MQETNKELRLIAKGAGVPLWKVAERLNISEPTLTRKLRYPLNQEFKTKILKIIENEKEGEK